MNSCIDWYGRDFLVRDALARGGVLVSQTEARMLDGSVVDVPAHCGHDQADCPPTPVVAGEPVCCDEPMIHNSFTGLYECAEAYFHLLDDGVLGDPPDLSDTDVMDDYQRERYAHWKTTRISDAAVVLAERVG
ncbi:hypothetical protein ABZ671_00620 [Micromonospora sp. NPDC006766]|uniref:hypothetical protein n=1 Tax=Micromonospora sp. NPDC006766 TaxID=3154778 RepID=UPI0033F46409